MQHPANMRGVQVVVLAQTDLQSRHRNVIDGSAQELTRLGVAHIVIGMLCIIFQAVICGVWSSSLAFHGFWTGTLFIIAGAFGITAGKKRGRCQVVTFNVLSILSVVFAAILLSIAIPSGLVFWPYLRYPGDQIKTMVAMESLMALLALAEGIVAIVSSSLCCSLGACCCNCGGSCCCPTDPPYQQFVNTDQPHSAQQQFIIRKQQQAISIGQSPLAQQQFVVISKPQQAVNTDQLPLSQQQFVISDRQQAEFNLNQQHPMFYPNQPMAGFNSQQPAVQCYPHQPNSLPNPHQLAFSAFSPEATSQGPPAGQYTGLTTTPLPAETKTKPKAEESCANPYCFDNADLFSHVYDYDSEYHY